MGSSGGGSSDPSALYRNAAPMADLPIAGAGSTIGSPFEYGQFQSFLPEIQAEGENPMATGLRPEMFQYKSPTGVTAPSNDTLGIESLRADLAKLMSNQTQNDPFGGMNQQFSSGMNPQFGGSGMTDQQIRGLDQQFGGMNPQFRGGKPAMPGGGY
jgi:hypothetical protein